MKAKWIIENGDLEHQNWTAIAAYLKETGREVFRPKYAPFTYESVKSPFGEEDCVVAFGCLGLVRSVGRWNKWVPGVWCDWDKMKCSYYLNHWWDYSVHHRVGFYPLEMVWKEKDFLYETFAKDEHVFIRPDDNFKTFNGELVAIEHWDSFRRNVECYEPASHTLCMVSMPVKIAAEWRFVVADGKIVTGSQYRLNRSSELSPDIDPLAQVFAEKVLNESAWRPHSLFVMDICRVESGEYKVVEIGSINGAGLYCCDIPKVVEAVCSVAEREWKEVYQLPLR
jgi:hypothetical protein